MTGSPSLVVVDSVRAMHKAGGQLGDGGRAMNGDSSRERSETDAAEPRVQEIRI